MDKKSKILLILFFVVMIAPIVLLYQRSFINNDFQIIDSSTESEISE